MPPPPAPAAEAPQALANDLARMAPPPAPLFWRTLAFVVDALLFVAIAAMLLRVWLIPEYYGVEFSIVKRWFGEALDAGVALEARLIQGQITAQTYVSELRALGEKVPAELAELIGYCASVVMMTCWIGFSASELIGGGVSLGKQMVRIRVASFPYAEKAGFFDIILRNLWKAAAVAGLSPFAMLFAVVDAHWPLFNPLRRSLHDYLSRTIVLDARFDPPVQKKSERVEDPDADEDE